MKTKFTVLAVSLVCLLVANTFYTNVISPELTTTLALEQFENPSIATDSVIRSQNSVNLFFYLYASWVALALFLFKENLKNVYSKISTSDSN